MAGQQRFIRFLLAGGLNTLFGFSVYSAAIWADLPVWAALLAANVTGVAFNFVTTGGYAFRRLLLAHFPRFLAAYLSCFIINWGLIRWLAHGVPNAIVAQAILTLPMAVLSYLIMSRWVFVEPTSPRRAPP